MTDSKPPQTFEEWLEREYPDHAPYADEYDEQQLGQAYEAGLLAGGASQQAEIERLLNRSGEIGLAEASQPAAIQALWFERDSLKAQLAAKDAEIERLTGEYSSLIGAFGNREAVVAAAISALANSHQQTQEYRDGTFEVRVIGLRPVDVAALRTALAKLELKDVSI